MEKRPEHRDGGVEWRVAMKPGRRRLLGEGVAEEAAEKRKASVRAKVEPVRREAALRLRQGALPGRGKEQAAHRVAAGVSNLLIAGRYATG